MHKRWFRCAALLVALAAAASAQIAILRIRIVEGDGAVHAPGSRSPRALAVEVTDESGRPVAGAAVSFHLPEEGPSGIFGNGLRTSVVSTDAAGRASAGTLVLNRLSGSFEIRVTASKEQARASIVSLQYIAEPASGAAHPAAAHAASHKKWLILAVLAGAAAAAGAVGASRPGSTTAAATPPSAPTISIGAPVVTVGKP